MPGPGERISWAALAELVGTIEVAQAVRHYVSFPDSVALTQITPTTPITRASGVTSTITHGELSSSTRQSTWTLGIFTSELLKTSCHALDQGDSSPTQLPRLP